MTAQTLTNIFHGYKMDVLTDARIQLIIQDILATQAEDKPVSYYDYLEVPDED